MIRRFRHKGLRRFFEDDDKSGVPATYAARIGWILDLLNAAHAPLEMNVAGLRLHPLRGDRKGQWAVTLSGNWRVVFRFEGEDAVDVDLVDYH